MVHLAMRHLNHSWDRNPFHGFTNPCCMLFVFPLRAKFPGCRPEGILATRFLARRMPSMNCLRISVGRVFRSCTAALAVLGLSAASALAFAQAPVAAEPGTAIIVSGTVRDPGGNPVANASVILEEKASNAAAVETKAKDDGTFSFSALPAGTYVVRTRAQGFQETATAPMELSRGEKKHLEIILKIGFIGGAMVESPKPTDANSGGMEFS